VEGEEHNKYSPVLEITVIQIQNILVGKFHYLAVLSGLIARPRSPTAARGSFLSYTLYCTACIKYNARCAHRFEICDA
jgi:hypothetical protein